MLTDNEKTQLERARHLVIQAKAIIDDLLTRCELDDDEQAAARFDGINDECYSVIVSIDNVISES